jgi:hypothetical protein
MNEEIERAFLAALEREILQVEVIGNPWEIWIPVIISSIVGLGTLLLVWWQLKTALNSFEQAIKNGQQITGSQRRLAAADLILRLETDGEFLAARRKFAELRDSKPPVKGMDSFTHLFETLDATQEALKQAEQNGKNYTDDESRQKAESERKDLEREYSILEDDYQKVINYLNILENLSIQIRRGAYDEQAIRLWHRSAYVRNITAAYDAIKWIRVNRKAPLVYIQAVFLACAWADGESECAVLGATDCARCRTELERELSQIRSNEAYLPDPPSDYAEDMKRNDHR